MEVAIAVGDREIKNDENSADRGNNRSRWLLSERIAVVERLPGTGVQSYVKDILRAYISLASQSGLTAEVPILRDPEGCPNPFEGNGCMGFHYCKTGPRWLSRIRLAIALLERRSINNT